MYFFLKRRGFPISKKIGSHFFSPNGLRFKIRLKFNYVMSPTLQTPFFKNLCVKQNIASWLHYYNLYFYLKFQKMRLHKCQDVTVCSVIIILASKLMWNSIKQRQHIVQEEYLSQGYVRLNRKQWFCLRSYLSFNTSPNFSYLENRVRKSMHLEENLQPISDSWLQ